jgi:phage terminase small subunit
MPPPGLRARWRAQAGDAGEDPGRYERRWRAEWVRWLEVLLEFEEFADEHVWLLRQFVEALRVAEIHETQAARAGYQETDSGRYFAHPGFDKARDRRREALALGRELLLTPKALRDAGLDTGGPEDEDPDEPPSDQKGL